MFYNGKSNSKFHLKKDLPPSQTLDTSQQSDNGLDDHVLLGINLYENMQIMWKCLHRIPMTIKKVLDNYKQHSHLTND